MDSHEFDFAEDVCVCDLLCEKKIIGILRRRHGSLNNTVYNMF